MIIKLALTNTEMNKLNKVNEEQNKTENINCHRCEN